MSAVMITVWQNQWQDGNEFCPMATCEQFTELTGDSEISAFVTKVFIQWKKKLFTLHYTTIFNIGNVYIKFAYFIFVSAGDLNS